MLLTRTCLGVTIPWDATFRVKRMVGPDIRTALRVRLAPETAAARRLLRKKTREEVADMEQIKLNKQELEEKKCAELRNDPKYVAQKRVALSKFLREYERDRKLYDKKEKTPSPEEVKALVEKAMKKYEDKVTPEGNEKKTN